MQSVFTTKTEIRSLLEQRTKSDQFKLLKELPQPTLFKDMQKATLRVVDAINNQETITIVGDYDVDGVVSTTIMAEFFQKAGIKINWIVPNRFKHGYGLSPKILEQIDSGLVITVDNGISAHEAANICKEKGIDLIITDHHTVGETLPNAYAIINPKQQDCNFPYKEICGAQVAWYFCANLKKALNLDINLMEFFDILAIAIIADVMPMRSLNAAIVKKGLKQIETSSRLSLQTLKQTLKKSTINEEDVGFFIAPLINCAGRMDDASVAVKFLLSNDQYEVNDTLSFLTNLNNQRKEQQHQIYMESLAQVNESDDVIVVSSENWNEGIIGIVAAKLSEKFKKPAFVFSITNDKAKGSSRSSVDINLYSLISSASETTIGFGGHKGAAGVVVATDRLMEFKEAVNKNVKELSSNDTPTINYFSQIDTQYIDIELYNIIEEFRPYGLTNELPIFFFKDIPIHRHFFIGKEKQHQKLILSDHIELLLFNNTDELQTKSHISFTATLTLNEFRGNLSINLIAKELL